MSEQALQAGADAFRRGEKRGANPYDASAEEWMCWRDGWEQAKAVAEHDAGGPSGTEPHRAGMAEAGNSR